MNQPPFFEQPIPSHGASCAWIGTCLQAPVAGIQRVLAREPTQQPHGGPGSIRLAVRCDIPSIAVTASMMAPAEDGPCANPPSPPSAMDIVSRLTLFVCLRPKKLVKTVLDAGSSPSVKSLPFATGCSKPTGRVAIPYLQTLRRHCNCTWHCTWHCTWNCTRIRRARG
jgi:hypothetical protein